ncbi:MAG: hypothetical protein QXJ77_03470 [Candidatus Bathyarchaeia archaeon]
MRLIKSRKALSTVVTTLIILVVSVLLATVVTFYAINATTTRVQEEYLQITKLHVWCDSSGDALAAFVVTNVGGRDAVIEKITIRGRAQDWSKICFWKLEEGDTLPSELVWADSHSALNSTYKKSESEYYKFFNASKLSLSALSLRSGASMVVYIFDIDNLSTSDIGVTVGVVVFTANAQYHKETNVEAYLPS